MSEEPLIPGFGLDLSFFPRVYRTSLVLIVLGALLVWERFKAPAALGWMVGSCMSLGALATVEWSVRRFVRPEAPAMNRLIGATMAKILLAAALMAVIFVGAQRGWVAPLWVLAGFALPHGVVFLKLIGRAVVAANRDPSGGVRR
jgi:hypothetical protein